MSRTFHRDDRTFSNFQEAELRKLCGVSQGEWPLYVVKELLDNASAALEESSSKAPMITVTIDDDYIEVADSGSGITDQVLDKVLDFSSFGGSNRHHKLPTRGAQGNAIMTIVGIVSCWETSLDLGRKNEPTIKLEIILDKVRQSVEVSKDELSDASEGSFIRVLWPKLPTRRGGVGYDHILSTVLMFARLNPHITFTVKSRFNHKNSRQVFPAEKSARPALTAQSGSASWFTLDEFSERLAADVRARPELLLSSWVKEFLGSNAPGAEIAIGDMVDSDAANLVKLGSNLRAKIVTSGSNVDDPGFAPVGISSLSKLLTDAGADLQAVPQYEFRKGVFHRGAATIPYLVEACLVQMPKGYTAAPSPVMAMNRTTLYGSPQIDSVKYREKIRGEWRTTRGSLDTYCNVYGIEHGSTPAAVVVHVTCPSPGYRSYGKHAFDTEWLAGPLSEVMEQVTLECRKQRLGESKRKVVNAVKPDSIKDTLLRVLPGVYDDYSEGGRLPILIRNLYYGVRGTWEQHHPEELQYGTFCAYVDVWEQQMGRPMVLKDPRGTLLEPHSGRTLRLGTDEVAKYNPKKWEGHTLIFIEKENFAHVIRDYGIMRRWDAIVIGSKGFAVESCREVLQKYKKLLGSQVKIIALHDADPAGYMIGRDLATNLPRFGENVDVQVIDVGLTIADGESMGLLSEPFELKQQNWSMINGMRKMIIKDQNGRRPLIEAEAWDAFMPEMYRGSEFPSWAKSPKGRRIELNAMKPRKFIEWLEGHLLSNGCKKVRPPDEIVTEEIRKSRENAVKNEVGNILMRLMGNDLVLSIMKEIGIPAYDLDSVLAGRPEQHWSYLVKRAGESNINFEDAVRKAVISTRPDLAGLFST